MYIYMCVAHRIFRTVKRRNRNILLSVFINPANLAKELEMMRIKSLLEVPVGN